MAEYDSATWQGQIMNIYKRYSVSREGSEWFPIGERNQYRFYPATGLVVEQHWKPGEVWQTTVGTGRLVSVTSGGPMWGDSPTFVFTIEATV